MGGSVHRADKLCPRGVLRAFVHSALVRQNEGRLLPDRGDLMDIGRNPSLAIRVDSLQAPRMTAVDPEWWEHLTPPAMHRHREAFDAILERFISTAYGAFWLRSAMSPQGVIRVSPGQPIPVLHAVALGADQPFRLPQRLVRPGHRFVGPYQMESGRPLAPDELALGPEIRFEVVTDPAMVHAVRTMDLDKPMDDVTEPTQVFSIPAWYLLRPEVRPGRSHVLYQHIFGRSGSYPDDGFFYVGITTRRWQTRWAEHQRAIATGSRLNFHRVFREETEARRVTYVHHKVMGVTDDVEVLYKAEEWLLKQHWEDKRRLNMIPGGRAGRRIFQRSKSVVAPPGGGPRTRRNARLSPAQVMAILDLRGAPIAGIRERVGRARSARSGVSSRDAPIAPMAEHGRTLDVNGTPGRRESGFRVRFVSPLRSHTAPKPCMGTMVQAN